jgi:hypothetical protein
MHRESLGRRAELAQGGDVEPAPTATAVRGVDAEMRLMVDASQVRAELDPLAAYPETTAAEQCHPTVAGNEVVGRFAHAAGSELALDRPNAIGPRDGGLASLAAARKGAEEGEAADCREASSRHTGLSTRWSALGVLHTARRGCTTAFRASLARNQPDPPGSRRLPPAGQDCLVTREPARELEERVSNG